MKRQLFTTALALLPFLPCLGQNLSSNDQEEAVHSTYPTQGFYIGIRATPQLSWMINKTDIDASGYKTLNRFGANFGLAGGYSFNDHIGAEVNVLYSLDGKRYKVSGKEYTQKVNYFKIPLLFVYTTQPATFMFLGKIGPQLNILSMAKVSPAITNGTTISDNKDQYETTVLGAVANAGARYAVIDNLWIDASIRYDISLTNVENKSYKYFPSGRSDTHNMTLGLEIGLNYLFK